MRHYFKSDVLRRSYRIVALAAIFFVVGVVFFIFDWRLRATQPTAPNFGGEAAPAPVAGEPRAPLSPLANYPAPATFERMTYDGKKAADQNYIEIGGKCTDMYFTVVIFPADFDYRNDPTRAVLNRATICPPEKTFTLHLTAADLRSLPKGEYYVIVADQGQSGLWYNPR